MSEEGIQDVENYQGGKEEISFRTIVLEQFRRVLRLGSVEFHGGFWMEVMDKTGKLKETYIPATHEAFSNGVNMLAAALHPYYDEEMSKAWKKHWEDVKKKKGEYDGKKKRDDDAHNNAVMNLWHHERANLQYDLFIALSDFLNRKGYLQDSDVTAET